MVILQSYFPSYDYQQDKSTYYDCWITLQTALIIAASNLYCKTTLVWLNSSLSVLHSYCEHHCMSTLNSIVIIIISRRDASNPDLKNILFSLQYDKQFILHQISDKIVTQTHITSLNHLTCINLYHVCFNKYVFNLYLKTAKEGAVFMLTCRALYSMGAAFWNDLSTAYFSYVRGTCNMCWSLHTILRQELS